MRMNLKKTVLIAAAAIMMHCKSYEDSFNRNVNSTGLYVTNSGSNTISQFAVDPGTGILNNMGTVAAGTTPYHIILNSAGTFAYVVNSGSNDVYVYSVNKATRKLAFASSVATGTTPRMIVFHRGGKFAYVANEGSTEISKFFVDSATGALSSLGTATGVGSPPVAIVSFLDWVFYAFNTNQLGQLTIDTTTGALSGAATSNLSGGANAAGISVLPLTSSNAMLYAPVVTNQIESIYTANFGGAIDGSIATGTNPGYVAFSSNSSQAFVSNFSAATISMYSVNTTTGILTAAATVDACTNPGQIISPVPGLAYVACYGAAKIQVHSLTATTMPLVGSYAVGTSPSSIATY